jgi:hypothetical protein
MRQYRYILEPYKGMNTRYRCPSCQQRDKTFSLYIDTDTGEHLHPTVGKCNRESNCGYHYTPKQYFQDNDISFDKPQLRAYKHRPVTPQPKPVSFIPIEVFKASLNTTEFETNHFVQYLINLFGVEVANQLVTRYSIATSKHWNGATVFWQIDAQGKVRTGKIMLYSPTTGKRIKDPFSHINWAHKAVKQPEFELKQCLFGEHLLNEKTKPVAIVESEKTAVIASVYFAQFIWLAAGSIDGLNIEKCSILKGRKIILFPDLNGFQKWSSKAKEFSHLATFIVSDLLERKANEAERKQGFDLADYLIKYDYKVFTTPELEASVAPAVIQPIVEAYPVNQIKSTIDNDKCQNINVIRDAELVALEEYFSSRVLPDYPIQIPNYPTIGSHLKLFINHRLDLLKKRNAGLKSRHYLSDLRALKTALSTKSQF